MDQITCRALTAFFRSDGDDGRDLSSSGTVEYAERTYVVIRHATALVAVYRVRTSGALKRLKVWPAEL